MESPGEEMKPPIADWIHPPEGVEELSLWDSLHDAHLIRAHVDPLERTLQLEFDIRHVRKFHHLPEDTRFMLRFNGVSSVRVNSSTASFDVSIGFLEFAEKVEGENGRTETFEADILRAPGSVAARLFLHVNDEFYPELIVRAECLAISLSSGKELTLEEFLQLGEAFWEDFAERGRKLRETAASTGWVET
jgi:hypothetical protein